MDTVKLNAAIGIAFGLIRSGMEIYNALKDKSILTDDDLQSIIDRENAEQEKARQKLKDLIG